MRILFVKTSSLGDVIHHCPAVSDAARHLPGAVIDWVVEDAFAGIVEMHPAVHRAIPVAVRRWRRAPWRLSVREEFAAFRRLLSGERYDAIVDTQGLLKSALISRLARGARHGYDKGSARESFASGLYAARHRVSRKLHAVERNRRLTAAALGYALGASPCDYGLRAPGHSPVDAGGPYCVLLTMTSRADKLWPEGEWVALGKALGREGVRCVLPWGSGTENARARRIASELDGAVVPPALALAPLGALMAQARAVVGVDTGLTHLAVALGAPTVGVYCSSDPALTGLYGQARSRNVGGIGAMPAYGEVLAVLSDLG